MKIYQIHKYGGVWEDSYDHIIGSYFSQEKAIAEKERLEKEEKALIDLNKRCNKCPLYSERSSKDIKKYCEKYELFDASKHDPNEYDEDLPCIHTYWTHWDSNYNIEEVIVIE